MSRLADEGGAFAPISAQTQESNTAWYTSSVSQKVNHIFVWERGGEVVRHTKGESNSPVIYYFYVWQFMSFSLSVTFSSTVFYLHLFPDIPPCHGKAIKQKEKAKEQA